MLKARWWPGANQDSFSNGNWQLTQSQQRDYNQLKRMYDQGAISKEDFQMKLQERGLDQLVDDDDE
ncbi:SHOCT domain-containing protein [Eupransor demetentiae]|uniref:SHOCT domain-containing protein n=1 Tax=Eupransor demetentiae TaxID=3109584 RepID=A0ABM9N3Z1_9LACO|nr:hypothetical protein R54876_GBNLAHCA_00428 [Lactobacillaceae bacterium LMG 33000]